VPKHWRYVTYSNCEIIRGRQLLYIYCVINAVCFKISLSWVNWLALCNKGFTGWMPTSRNTRRVSPFLHPLQLIKGKTCHVSPFCVSCLKHQKLRKQIISRNSAITCSAYEERAYQLNRHWSNPVFMMIWKLLTVTAVSVRYNSVGTRTKWSIT